jgi:hypothetical protein
MGDLIPSWGRRTTGTFLRGQKTVGARQSLNVAYLNGCLLTAAIVGSFAESGVVFIAALAVLVGCACYAGQIRLAGRNKIR